MRSVRARCLLLGSAIAACGGVAGPSGFDGGDAPADAADRPERPDGSICFSDGFDGASLQPHWQVVAGAAPTYTLASSSVVIDDAPFASTPSNPQVSWIFEPDTDLGNQLAWAHPIGTGDFRIEGTGSWSSSDPELTLAGIGLSNADHQLELQVGVIDGLTNTLSAAYVRLRRAGEDAVFAGAPVASASGPFRIERAAGALVVELSGTIVLSEVTLADITHVVLFAVRYTDSAGPIAFGNITFDSVSICY
jgi:hypothetical protein